MTILSIDGLSVAPTGSSSPIIADITLSVESGEIVGVVGESGAGKTTLGLAAVGHLRAGMEVLAGDVRFGGTSLLTPRTVRSDLRGRRISFVSQHPASALNPALRIGAQLSAMLPAHDRRTATAVRNGSDPLRHALRTVSLPDSAEFLRRYPHQLSGGQMQRVAIAIALVCSPDLVVLDEPTSGLDATTSSHVLDTIRRLSSDRGLAVLCISHDLALVAAIADRVSVLYAGQVVEEGPTHAVLADPAHPYTRHLVAAIPAVGGGWVAGLPGRAPAATESVAGCRFGSRCDRVRDECHPAVPQLVSVGSNRRARCIDPYVVPHRLGADAGSPTTRRPSAEVTLSLRDVTATHGGDDVVKSVSLEVATGEWLAVVGESGAGKTTLMRTIAGAHADRRGAISFAGAPLAGSVRRRTPSERQQIQLIGQHPYESFNPRRVVGASIARPLSIRGIPRLEKRRAVDEALDLVSLATEAGSCYPDELSGGELQRAAIARAIIGRPQLLLCDEITASLDSVVRVGIVELLDRLRAELDLTIVFVGHDLGLVETFTDRTAVLADGRLVETGSTADVFARPIHPRTQELFASRRLPPG